MLNLENGPVWAGIAALIIREMFAQVREERRHRRSENEKAEAQAAAKKDRQKVLRSIRNLRPDTHCAQRGCPLALKPQPENVRSITSAQTA